MGLLPPDFKREIFDAYMEKTLSVDLRQRNHRQ